MTVDPHLDANLIGAFLDGGLSPRRRRPVLRHIESCDHCRRLAACANTAMDMAVAGVPFRTAAAPRRLRPLIWAAPLAAAVAVAFAAGPGWWRQAPPSLSPILATAAARPPLVVSSTAAAASVRPHPRVLRTHMPAANPPFVLAATTTETMPALAAQLLDLPLAPPGAGADSIIQPSIDFSPLTTGFVDQPPLTGARAQTATWNMPAGVAARAATLVTADAGNDGAAADTAPAASSPRVAFASALTSSSGPYAPSVPAGLGWALSHSGKILRSVGGVWSAVPVPSGIHFHAVQALDNSLWAGGTVNQLYVSQDRGQHWRPVHLPQAGAGGAATITGINFADPQHGAIFASNGASWVSEDGGQHWRLADH